MGSSHARVSPAIFIALLVLLAGCTGSGAPSAPAMSLGPPASTSPSTPATSASPASTTAATAAPSLSAAPSPRDPLVSTVQVTVVDSLRVRSRPRISDDSDKYEPLLPRGTPLFVIDGPVSASGYAWYEVVQLTSRTLPRGWVASAGRDGVPWIAPGAFDCPPPPTDVRSLAALPAGVGLACFSRVPITVQARLVDCNCDVDGGGYTPSWFSWGGGTSELLVAPEVTSPPPDTDDWFVLNLDPAGEHPDVLPVGRVVEVTGVFDHPAAASCTRAEIDSEPVPSQDCRLAFAVTRLGVEGT